MLKYTGVGWGHVVASRAKSSRGTFAFHLTSWQHSVGQLEVRCWVWRVSVPVCPSVPCPSSAIPVFVSSLKSTRLGSLPHQTGRPGLAQDGEALKGHPPRLANGDP